MGEEHRVIIDLDELQGIITLFEDYEQAEAEQLTMETVKVKLEEN